MGTRVHVVRHIYLVFDNRKSVKRLSAILEDSRHGGMIGAAKLLSAHFSAVSGRRRLSEIFARISAADDQRNAKSLLLKQRRESFNAFAINCGRGKSNFRGDENRQFQIFLPYFLSSSLLFSFPPFVRRVGGRKMKPLDRDPTFEVNYGNSRVSFTFPSRMFEL